MLHKAIRCCDGNEFPRRPNNPIRLCERRLRPCETPVFLPKELLVEMELAGKELIAQLCLPDYLAASSRAVPAEFHAPKEGSHPHFIQVDFAVTREADGRFAPKLIELQGCASLYAFQYLLPHEYRRVYDLGELTYLLGGLTDEGRDLDRVPAAVGQKDDGGR